VLLLIVYNQAASAASRAPHDPSGRTSVGATRFFCFFSGGGPSSSRAPSFALAPEPAPAADEGRLTGDDDAESDCVKSTTTEGALVLVPVPIEEEDEATLAKRDGSAPAASGLCSSLVGKAGAVDAAGGPAPWTAAGAAASEVQGRWSAYSVPSSPGSKATTLQ